MRGQRGDGLDDDVHLAAEAAAHRAAHEVQPIARHLQDDRRVVEAEVERLRVRVDGHPAVGLGHGDAAGRLDGRVLDGARVVAALDDVVGRRERRLDVAQAHAPAGMPLVHEGVRAPVGDDRGTRLERCLDVEDGRQLLEVESDPGHRLVRGRLRLGHDGDDGLALETDTILGQHELLFWLDTDERQDGVPVVRHVRGDQGPDEARHPLGLGQVDATDARVMQRAADHLQMEHAGEDAIRREGRPAGHVPDGVAPPDRAADRGQLGAHGVRSPTSSCLAAAATATARRMGW